MLPEVRLIHSKITDAMKDIHDCIESCFEFLENAGMGGLSVTAKDYRKIWFHFLLSSHLAKMPKTDSLLRLMRGSQTVFLTICVFPIYIHHPHSLKQRVKLWNIQNHCWLENAVLVDNNIMRQGQILLSTRPVLSIFRSFPFVRIHSLVDLFAIFRNEPMHAFSLGISKMWKNFD